MRTFIEYSIQNWGEVQFLPQNEPETVRGPGPAEEAYNAPSYTLTGFKG